ncbi:histone deacetylase family protein [Wenzhouxiangella sp. AB-CW3]|uniref:histone deacetylase family protein n=1 Tax=Wenzhouxiangella sp. AB-CW3 TaxID=2771012 RepID=UPI00168C0EA1|nr:histone deacetylase family protein [Wenzhouxiangella sp. AB-CW3]QOC21750.1 histone deacetylase family protein [Wenzhouxiangella sp. AB-CW3]
MSLLVLTHADCRRHTPPEGHPERPERLDAALRGIDEIKSHRQRPAEPAQHSQLLLAHGPNYLNSLENLAAAGNRVSLDSDTHLGPGSLRAASLAAGAACQGVDEVMRDAGQSAFAIVRPPGHHAESARAMGFCFYNSIAIAALHAVETHGLDRVAVCDFDVHHGNGTEAILAGNSKTLFLSSHQSPLYPGTGQPDAPHADNVRNHTLPTGSGSNEFRELWLEHLLPELEQYRPQLILVSAGFDAHWRDPLAQLELKDEDYYWIGDQLKALARKSANGRLVASLEGGYDLKGLKESVLAFGEGIE